MDVRTLRVRGLAVISSGSMVVHIDFDVFWHSARAFWEGRNLYYDTGGRTAAQIRHLDPVHLTARALEPLTAYRSFVLITVLATLFPLREWLLSCACALARLFDLWLGGCQSYHCRADRSVSVE
jgi:hypothetical protein